MIPVDSTEVPNAFDDDVMAEQTERDWLLFQRDMEADWRPSWA